MRALLSLPRVDAAGELSDETKRLANKARKEKIKIIVENPVNWLNGKQGGDACRQMHGELTMQLARLGLSYSAHPIAKSHTLAPRQGRERQLRFSYHSAGDEDRVWRIKESYIPPFFTWDRLGFSGWSTLARSQELFALSHEISAIQAHAFASALRRQVTEQKITKYRQSSTAEAPSEKSYVLYAMQVPGDVVMTHSRFKQLDLLHNLVHTAEAEKKPLVVKRHPMCRCEKTDQALAEVARVPYVTLSQAHIHTLFEGAQSVVVANSGVGMEAVLQGKPVFTTALSDYKWATHEVTREEQLSAPFQNPAPRLDPEALDRFITLYFGLHCVNALEPLSIEYNLGFALKDWLLINS